jgi:PIN domain nuclease of toxin-antitoxin system
MPMLIARAVADGLAIATNDEPVSEYPVRTTW